MSEKCLYCQAPIEQKEGKRERMFCTPSHCTMYHLKNKNKDKPKGQRGRPAGAKNKGTLVGAVPLPKDYVSFDNIGVLNEDGSITPIDTSALDGLDLGVSKEAINELLTFGTTTVKTELVDGNVKQSVVNKKQIVPTKMPEGLDWRQQLEWKRNNKK